MPTVNAGSTWPWPSGCMLPPLPQYCALMLGPCLTLHLIVQGVHRPPGAPAAGAPPRSARQEYIHTVRPRARHPTNTPGPDAAGPTPTTPRHAPPPRAHPSPTHDTPRHPSTPGPAPGHPPPAPGTPPSPPHRPRPPPRWPRSHGEAAGKPKMRLHAQNRQKMSPAGVFWPIFGFNPAGHRRGAGTESREE